MPCLIINPHAGGGRVARWLQAHAPALQRAHPTLQWQLCADAAAARAVVQALPPRQRVIVAGGDGTVQGLLAALVAGEHTLALLPAGHGDDLARALGVRRLTPRAALNLALTGIATLIDLGAFHPLGTTRAATATTAGAPGPAGTAAAVVPGAPGAPDSLRAGRAEPLLFASSLCCGLDAAIAQRASRSRDPARAVPGSGLLRYLRATATEVRRMQPVHLQVRVDGRAVHDSEALFASVLNTPTYGAGMRAAPRARPDDGQLEVLIAGRFGRWGVLAMLPRLLLGLHTGHPRVQLLPAETVELRAERPLPLAADGEALEPATAWRVQVRPAALRVVQHPSPRAADNTR